MAKQRNQLGAARKHLTDAQLIAFLREAAKEEFPRAPGYMCKDLDRGGSLERIFDPPLRPKDRAALMRAVLEVKQVDEMTYLIRVGYRGEVGDGGVWRVRYNALGELVELQEGTMWMH